MNLFEVHYSNEILPSRDWIVELCLEIRILGKGLFYWHFCKIHDLQTGEWFRGNTLARSATEFEWEFGEALGFYWRRLARWR